MSNKEVIEFREKVVERVEHLSQQMWESGDVARWMSGADPWIQKICCHVNGPLMQILGREAGYEDVACVDLFREGAQLAGDLPSQGEATCKAVATMSVSELKANSKN